jgi:uncharacterized protein (DUF39 family)
MNVYIIWYGTHSAATKANLTTLVSSIGNTPYWNINKTYTNAAGVALSGAVTFKKAVVDTGTATSLSDAAIRTIVSNHLANGDFTRDPNGIYLVLTGTNVTASSGFCTQYCGWHTHFTSSGVDIKYSFVGSFALPELVRGAESGSEWRLEHGWYGFDHRSRDGRSADRSGPERLVSDFDRYGKR